MQEEGIDRSPIASKEPENTRCGREVVLAKTIDFWFLTDSYEFSLYFIIITSIILLSGYFLFVFFFAFTEARMLLCAFAILVGKFLFEIYLP